MLRFVAGVVFGLVIGASAMARADVSVGGDIGWLFGWQVKMGDEVVCKNPQVRVPIKEITCRGK